jgi:hypothetical protein
MQLSSFLRTVGNNSEVAKPQLQIQSLYKELKNEAASTMDAREKREGIPRSKHHKMDTVR